MADLQEFQMAAVDRIVGRLTDPKGSRRFLLADEVGLGKTLVAKAVIDELQHRRRQKGLTVVYICSNSEIADQNCDKLCDEKDSKVVGRLTLLALQSKDIRERRDNGVLQVFAFTPGTSLHVQQGTGITWERRLLLYLVFRVWRKRVNRKRFRQFFRCSAGEERWLSETRFRSLKAEFFRSISGDLLTRLKSQWESQEVHLVDAASGIKDPKGQRLNACLDACVEALAQESGTRNTARRNRNAIIGELRKGLARVSLEFLEPGLTILDEFQRFHDILLESRDQESIVGKLFSKGAGAILILSATPYRMYTLPHESEDHHKGFLQTLAFLRNEPPDGLKDIKGDLGRFRERLTQGGWQSEDDQELFELRARLENRLKEVMCRTERNWYLADAGKGVEEVTDDGLLPERPELLEYVRLRQFLLTQQVGDWNITDFWKSSPSVVSFMDSHYALIARLRRGRYALPSALLRQGAELSQVGQDNAKCRILAKKVFGQDGDSATPWKYLWVRPTYTYYQDQFYKGVEPTKFLVFSHWRFVPKAISVLTSMEASRRLGKVRRRTQSSPLQFRKTIALYLFDACYPSLALASCVDPLSVRRSLESVPTDKQLFREARSKVHALLEKSHVRVGTGHSAPLWKVMARIEQRSPFEDTIRDALGDSKKVTAKETSDHLARHVSQYLAWMDSGAPLSISPKRLDRLTQIALYSPAVSLLRAFQTVFPQQQGKTWAHVLKFALGPLRHYFNKRLVQLIVRRHGLGASYTEKTLSYCQKAHFQPVMDEYAYLVRHVLQQKDPVKFLAHVERAMGMWSGMPKVNERTRQGHISRRPRPCTAHFALAFGDDVSSESDKLSGKARKSAVREAFNSPFWPFVLATTSVGQEGLDFHLYCRDIVHWNLPSNPVDLEQREGRINRYDGLSIRRNVASDFPLERIDWRDGDNLWFSVFQQLTNESSSNGRFKHGLYPHWIYQTASATGSSAERAIIRRHVPFYSGSRDRRRYMELKSDLALYRLVFGQPRQQDILERVVGMQQSCNPQELTKALAKYMINLSPFDTRHARDRADVEAKRLLSSSKGVSELLQYVPQYLAQLPSTVLEQIRDQVHDLLGVIAHADAVADVGRRQCALAALLYLLDPYDAIHDRHGAVGFTDDVVVIRDAHREVCQRVASGVGSKTLERH